MSKDRVVKVSQPAGTKSMKPGLKTEIDVIKISVHPAYSVGPPVNYDYAVLTLDKEASPQVGVLPFCDTSAPCFVYIFSELSPTL